jgi:hypothetical protein
VSTQIQYRRGTGVQNDAFTGALGEVTVDTTNKTLRVHDGVAVGGSNIATVAYVSAQLSALSANKINQNASNVTVTASFVNVAVNGTNVAAFSSQSLSLTGFLNVSGNVLGSTASFGGINSTGLINTSGNILSTGLSVFGNTRIGSLATPGALHTIIGNVDVSGAGTEYFNIGGNILAIQGSFGSINSTGFINTSANVSAAIGLFGSINSTGFINTSANVSAAIGLFGSINSTGFINTSGNVSAAIGSFDSITVRAAVTAIANGGTSGVGNIGATGATFNTVFAKATTAQYADLAEVYTSDQAYTPGTVLVFDGESEVTQSHSSHDTRIAGVVSTNPAYLMNHDTVGVPVALQGRVPCRVLGPVSKGDRVVASHIAGVAQALDPQQYQPGCIIGKALQAVDSTDISIIEVVVGRL